MMNFTFENQGTNTYLVYTMSSNDIVDTMSLGMLTNNKISGLATTLFTQTDDKKYIKYNVSAKVSSKQFFTGAVNKKRLLGVFEGIVDALLAAEDYMIDEKTVLLDMNYIFADVSTCETVLICLPIQGYCNNQDLGSFFKNIMFSTQFDQTENCDYVAKIINYLNSTPRFSLLDFKELLDSINKTTVSIVQQPKVQAVEPPKTEKTVAPKSVVQPVVKPVLSVPDKPSLKQMQVVAPPVNQSSPQVSTQSENKISMFGLLMHYNKENVELYKAQKAAKKAANGVSNKPITPQQNKHIMQNTGFAVPGMNPVSDTPSFAVPGQQNIPISSNKPQPVQPKVDMNAVSNSVHTVASTSSPKPTCVTRGVSKDQPVNFGETTVLGGGAIGETTVLTAAQDPNKIIAPHIIRQKNNEKILLNKPVFRIGKERSYVDYFIGDNTAISRSHANIISRDGEYFVVDTNSTNHTFVNGTMIQSNVEKVITHGDKLRFANEDFEFRLY